MKPVLTVAFAATLLFCAQPTLWAAGDGLAAANALDGTDPWHATNPSGGDAWRAPIPVRFSGSGTPGAGLLGGHGAGAFDARAALADAHRQTAGPSLMKLYRDALMAETRRSMRRDPSLFWLESFEGADADLHEGLTMHRARRSAERIFGEAHEELMADALNHVIETTGPLNALNARIRGVDFRVRAGSSRSTITYGDVPVREERREGTKVSFVVSNKPRLEMERLLPGNIKASVEIPLANPGLRTTFSRPIAGAMRGTLSFGVEDMGEEYWVSAGLRCGF